MSPHEMIDRFVPSAPIIAYRGTVPPFGIELSISESHHLRQGIEDGLEDSKETGKPDDKANGAKLHEAFDDGSHVQGS